MSMSDLHGCDVYLLDVSGQVLVDDCSDCTFFVGPVSGSVFIRDCSDCKCAPRPPLRVHPSSRA